mgnify:CR=1 FL=1
MHGYRRYSHESTIESNQLVYRYRSKGTDAKQNKGYSSNNKANLVPDKQIVHRELQKIEQSHKIHIQNPQRCSGVTKIRTSTTAANTPIKTGKVSGKSQLNLTSIQPVTMRPFSALTNRRYGKQHIQRSGFSPTYLNSYYNRRCFYAYEQSISNINLISNSAPLPREVHHSWGRNRIFFDSFSIFTMSL